MVDSRPITLPDGSVVHSDPEILSGTLVFVGTRVPVGTLVEYLEGGYSVDEFLDNFPSVRRQQVDAILSAAHVDRAAAARLPDPVIDEIREVRHQISARIEHDPVRLGAYYMELQEQYRDRLLHPHGPGESGEPTG
jgi:uncharacterized protein (DUF433 family)